MGMPKYAKLSCCVFSVVMLYLLCNYILNVTDGKRVTTLFASWVACMSHLNNVLMLGFLNREILLVEREKGEMVLVGWECMSH
jgi:hypothetical protein